MNAKWITPVVTAFDAEGHVDLEANKRIYEHLMQGGYGWNPHPWKYR